ncbi:NfeD family protein [Undibacterium rugosum]|uniref:NfeD family protein n=1 Tax=Undibacterium rugosum TaxID=2762291 RepID=UPI001B82C20B|nr:NfeD family protein [Undibacterium rugosum]MBR7778844.1 NfeD family protein [Undibacterium rugosum]
MSNWTLWCITAGVVVSLELLTGTFYLLMIALGLAAAALAAFFGAASSAQLIVAGLVGGLATLILHKSPYGWKPGQQAERDPNVNMDVGQRLQVEQWHDLGDGSFQARTMYRGAMWDVELHHGAGLPGSYQIQEVQGSRLIVRPA